jgi:hypothetical protein
MKILAALRVFSVLFGLGSLLLISGCGGGWGSIIAEVAPILTWTPIPNKAYASPAFPVSASSKSPGAITYSVVSGPATISGSTVTVTGAGVVTLLASQKAAGSYSAISAKTSFTVTPVTITPISPAHTTMAPGTQTFHATASGGYTDKLTWSVSGGSITSGGVWTSPSTVGTYTITATSVDDPAVSVRTLVTIDNLPVITTQPVSRNVCAGTNQSLTVAASNASSYEWYKNGVAAGSGATLALKDVTSANSGSYDCVASNAVGSVTSNTAIINVVAATTPAITVQPASISAFTTQTATFSVGLASSGSLAYQWYTGTPGSGTAISGATSSTYTTGALTTADTGTSYYVTVSDASCSGTVLTSSAATLTVSNADTAVGPTIIVQPSGQSTTVGGSPTFTVVATGPGTLSYQWYEVPYSSTQATTAGTAIPGATQSSYTVPSADTAQSDDGDEYYVFVTNGFGTALSQRAGLAVGAGVLVQINGEPQTEYVAANGLATFNVSASCTGCTPAYQWYWIPPGSTTAQPLSDGAVSSGALSGATVSGSMTSGLNIQNAPTSAAGSIFYVVITSTSNGSTPIPGTDPLTSIDAGLFVGPLASVGNATADQGLCNSSTTNWVLNGTDPGLNLGMAYPEQVTPAPCTMLLTNLRAPGEVAAVYWPTLISTSNFTASFTVTVATPVIASSPYTPAEGFAMILADPSQGATTASQGLSGEGLDAAETPGFVLGVVVYQDGNDEGGPLTYGCSGNVANGACDPITVPYIAIGQSAQNLWKNPWAYVNGNLNMQNSTNYLPNVFANAAHSYVVSINSGIMTLTMDGFELFTGQVSVPPVAYFGFTGSTAGNVLSIEQEEQSVVSNLTVTTSAP